MERNKVFILSAPSGAGKTTVMKGIMKEIPKTKFIPSTTSRYQRPNEVNGVDYNFISPDEFKKMIENNEFIEYEEVYPNEFYGTPKVTNPESITIMIKDVLGGISLKNFYGDDCITFFIKPPSIEILEKRLRERGTETEEQIKKRLERAQFEMTFEDKYDYSVLNDELECCLNVICSIIEYNFF
jgi:guanylate kinase